jgi:putative endonuclease
MPGWKCDSQSMRSHNLGRVSEDIAGRYLLSEGWTIVCKNYRAGHKEIDIVAKRGNTIAFVEVKARSRTDRGHGFEAINWKKRRELAAAARRWIGENGWKDSEYRFDAIAITWNGNSHILEHIENAWMIVR